ncbi:hypothetical protein ACLB2K_024387 [Fragaria x ananassa]
MENTKIESYYCFMNYDPQYALLRSNQRKKGRSDELDLYLSRKHDEVLESTLEPGTYRKTESLVIVDGFAVEITEDQASKLRSAKGVRVVEKNEEIA